MVLHPGGCGRVGRRRTTITGRGPPPRGGPPAFKPPPPKTHPAPSPRNLNNAYREGFYLDLYDEAFELWQDLEAVSGKPLLTLCGLVTHGDSEIVHDPYAFLKTRNASVDLLSPEQAAEHWPGIICDGDVLFSAQAGRSNAETALDVLATQAKAYGAKILYGQRVVSMDRHGGRVHVVVQDADWPSFNHFTSEIPGKNGRAGAAYGMYTPGEGVKVGFHLVGDETPPDQRPFRASDHMRQELRGYVNRWFPGVESGSAVDISCTYTSTASGRFVLDTVNEITAGAGFSGHGFKFVPAVGRILADASLGVAKTPREFRLDGHLRS